MEDDDIVFIETAFYHGLTEEDIRWAVTHPEYEDLLKGYQNKHLVLGFDTKLRLLEVMYNRLDDNKVRVFHAMKCRSIYFPLLEE